MIEQYASGIVVGPSPGRGRGVFAARMFKTGDLIERAPVLAFPGSQAPDIDRTGFYDYYFAWGEDGDDIALALGFGSLYNHSYSPNARYEKRLEELFIEVYACNDIQPGEEITLNYNGEVDDRSELWFLPV